MNLAKVKTVVMLCVCVSMMAMGLYMIFEGMFHVSDVEGGHTSVEIVSIGKITGNQRIMIVAFGMLMIFLSAKFLWRIDITGALKRPTSTLKSIKHYITKSGKEIARRMREKDAPEGEE